jgi:nitrate/nitrite transporter NarK
MNEVAQVRARSQRKWLVFGLLSISYLLAFSQRTGPGVIADQLQQQFRVSSAVLGSMASIQYLLYMVLQVPVGLFGDEYGPEILFFTGVLLDGAGTLVFSHAGSFPWLLVGRAVVGMGDALIWVNIVLILGKWFKAREFASTLGLVGTAGNLGALLATIPFAAWVAVSGWHLPFTILGSLLVLVAIINYVGLIGPQWPWRRQNTEQQQILKFDKVPVGLTLRSVLRDRVAWATFSCHFGVMGSYIGFTSVWATPYFMSVYHLSRSSAAQFTLVGFVGALLGGPLMGFLSDRTGQRRGPYIVLQVASCLAWFIFVWCDGYPSVYAAYMGLFVVGFGCGGSLLTFATIRDMTPYVRSGATSGFANTGGFLSAVFLPVLFGTVIDAFTPGAHAPDATIRHAYGMAFLVPALFSVVGVVGSILIPKNNSSGGNV